ncbi:hypothetical protein EYC84_007580 [Monilinia fructicola]|uniref:26S proteasome regulatory subunit 4 homolog n=1 Tax=Monilinia fructicola TaxID=38448 RepID=A0A5M9JH00_MONFR|nr:hypothetical protein EYC84_007580 [Monilinia fructicola]
MAVFGVKCWPNGGVARSRVAADTKRSIRVVLVALLYHHLEKAGFKEYRSCACYYKDNCPSFSTSTPSNTIPSRYFHLASCIFELPYRKLLDIPRTRWVNNHRALVVTLQVEMGKMINPRRRTSQSMNRHQDQQRGLDARSVRLPAQMLQQSYQAVYPTSRCKLRYLRMQRIHDHLLLEEEYVENQERLRKAKAVKEGIVAPAAAGGDADAADRNADERGRVDDMRGSPMGVGTLEEMIDDDHAIVSSTTGPEYYVSIMSFVDKDLLEPGASILVVLESQIQEVRESVELPLLHPELYEEMGIKPPKGVILYGAPGTGKTLLAKAVANQTSATFLRIVGSELIQKYLGDGPRLVRQLFQVAAENAPSIVFIDEIDAIGTKRYESTSGGEREIQRTMLELLNQLDGFDDRGDVKVIMATNKIDTLDPALIRPGRIDRKILFENPDQHTKRKIFTLHTSKMSLNEDVDLEEFINQKDDLSGADIKAICSEAGLMALRERRMRVQMADFRAARERVLKTKSEGEPEGLYLAPASIRSSCILEYPMVNAFDGWTSF